MRIKKSTKKKKTKKKLENNKIKDSTVMRKIGKDRKHGLSRRKLKERRRKLFCLFEKKEKGTEAWAKEEHSFTCVT